MNKVIVCLIVAVMCFAISPTRLSAQADKIKHFGVSMLFGAAGESCLHYATDLEGDKRILIGTALGTVPGLFKELMDSTKEGNRFSGGDFAADILGSFSGALLSNAFNNKIQIGAKVSKKRQIWIVSLRCSF